MIAAAFILAAASLVDSGFSHFYNLEYDEALADFERACAAEPKRPELHNHIAQTLVFREMLRDGALESELVSGNNSFLRRPKMNPPAAVEERFKAEIATSLQLCEERLKANPRDMDALYAQGIAYGLRANYNYLVRKAWRDSLRDATAGRKAHNRISEIDPSNIDARLVQGLHDYIIGSLPAYLKIVGFVAGFRGDRETGIRTIQDVAKNGNVNRVDAQLFLCALYRREGKQRAALPLLDDLLRRFPRNYLLHFEKAEMYSGLGDKDRALSEVRAVAAMKKHGAPVPWQKIWFQEGTIQFWYRDFEEALANMQRVVASPEELDLNTGVLAWMRIGQIHDVSGRHSQAVAAYKNAMAFAPESEAAKESRRYITSPYRRK